MAVNYEKVNLSLLLPFINQISMSGDWIASLQLVPELYLLSFILLYTGKKLVQMQPANFWVIHSGLLITGFCRMLLALELEIQLLMHQPWKKLMKPLPRQKMM